MQVVVVVTVRTGRVLGIGDAPNHTVHIFATANSGGGPDRQPGVGVARYLMPVCTVAPCVADRSQVLRGVLCGGENTGWLTEPRNSGVRHSQAAVL